MNSVRGLYLLVIAQVSWLFSGAAFAALDDSALLASPEMIPALVAEGKLAAEKIPNPHWRQDACSACHRVGAPPARTTLRNKNPAKLCGSCHETEIVQSYIHAVGMAPPDDFRARMPEEFRNAVKRDGNIVTCTTCHDLVQQCDRTLSAAQKDNPRFFRGGPYQARTDICFNCHNRDNYERHNPHDQIGNDGVLNTQSCYFCHNATPDRRKVRDINDVTFSVEGDLTRLCIGCHPYQPHPAGSNHLRVPPPPIEQRLKRMARREGIILPLEPGTGRIFCGTCHNPHERGVQHSKLADKGADGFKRLRRGGMTICLNCHDK